jgi:hypothetical protein
MRKETPRGALAICAALGVAAGCAQVLGLSDHEIESQDASSPDANGVAHVDATPAIDANQPIDSTLPIDAMQATDASDAANESMSDALLVVDASDAAIADAYACDGTFCQCNATHTFCSDFDLDGANFPNVAFPWSQFSPKPTGVDAFAFNELPGTNTSPPNSLVVQRYDYVPPDGAPNYLSPSLDWTIFPPLQGLTTNFDIEIESLPQPVTIFLFFTNPNQTGLDFYQYLLNAVLNSGALTLSEQYFYYEGGAPETVLGNVPSSDLTVGSSAWVHIAITITLPAPDAGATNGGTITATIGARQPVSFALHAPPVNFGAATHVSLTDYSSCAPECLPSLLRMDSVTFDTR